MLTQGTVFESITFLLRNVLVDHDHMLSQKLSLTSQFMDMKTRTNSNLFLVLKHFVIRILNNTNTLSNIAFIAI